VIEHRYPEGNRLTLTLLGAVEGGGAVASVYAKEQGEERGYVVRGFALTGVTASGGEAFCLRSADEPHTSLDAAWDAARALCARLSAAVGRIGARVAVSVSATGSPASKGRAS
jgi:hypothetical protein